MIHNSIHIVSHRLHWRHLASCCLSFKLESEKKKKTMINQIKSNLYAKTKERERKKEKDNVLEFLFLSNFGIFDIIFQDVAIQTTTKTTRLEVELAN